VSAAIKEVDMSTPPRRRNPWAQQRTKSSAHFIAALQTGIVYRSSKADDPRALAALSGVIRQLVEDPVDGQNLFAVSDAFGDAHRGRITLCEIDDKIAGVAATYLSTEGSHGWLQSLGVLPAFRNLGLATALIQRSIDDRRHVDGQQRPLFAQVRILPDDTLNLGSARALKRVGFVPTHTETIALEPLGDRAAHLLASAEKDGCVRGLIMAKIPVVTAPGL
jgi:GNAT superfamily N-acetyltransferase